VNTFIVLGGILMEDYDFLFLLKAIKKLKEVREKLNEKE
jgi:hypothetical protein